MKKLIFFYHLLGISYAAFILNTYLPTCEYKLKKHDLITVIRKDWTIFTEQNNGTIIFNLCESVKDGICKEHMACIKNKTTDAVTFLNGYFQRTMIGVEDAVVLRSNDTNCTLTVKWSCSLSKQDETKVNVNGCDYEVTLMSLSDDCTRPCTAIINAQLLDLTPLKRTYTVNSKLGNFSISLCDVNTNCRNNASSCLINGDTILPISSGSELVTYNVDSSEIKLHKKSHFKTREKIFELFIKCNWSSNNVTNFYYKEPANQGKTYKFEMESSYGCVKLPPVCEKNDKSYKYNLSKVYNNLGYIEVKNVPNSRTIFINICGPLKLPYSDNNICTKSSSQVCEIRGREYINKGSIYTNLITSEEKISMSILTGSKCNDTTYKTTIDFHCSEHEDSPRFLKEDNCELFLTWNTPVACPEPNRDSCKNIQTDTFKCDDIMETIQNDNVLYDLNKLLNPDGYVVKNKNIEYHLNICGPIKDKDAPCKKNSGFLVKYLDEYDIRKKVKSFGKFNKPYLESNYLVMETAGGDYCNEMNIDYKSVIHFECSNKENINVINATACTVELLWKTNQACPSKTWSTKRCLFNHPLGDKYQLDLTELKKPSLLYANYLFDLCGNDKSQCASSNCIYVPANKNLTVLENKTYIDFNLNTKCIKNTLFNKAQFELVCDDITENDHYVYKETKECTMVFQLKTNLVCYKKEVIVPYLIDQEANNVKYHVNSNLQSTVLPSCIVKNQYTNYEFNISLLNLNVSLTKCPDIAFNFEDQLIHLVYYSTHNCQKENGDVGAMEFRVMLKCKTEHYLNSTTNGVCVQNRTYELIEACKLLEKNIINSKNTHAYSSGIIAAIVISVLVGISLVSIFFYWKYKDVQRRNRTYGSLYTSYEKYE